MGIPSKTMIVGIGSFFRSDDAAGLIVIRKLRGRLPQYVSALEHEGSGASLLETWQGAVRVTLIDAVSSGAEPGHVFRIDLRRARFPKERFRRSTHALNLPDTLALARALGRLPRQLLCYGIEGKNFEVGIGLSRPVEEGTSQVADLILSEFRAPSWTGPTQGGGRA